MSADFEDNIKHKGFCHLILLAWYFIHQFDDDWIKKKQQILR
jgi:hypothetical protein